MNVYGHFFSITSELLLVSDRRGRIERTNPRWLDILGYEPREIEGTLFYDLIHPLDVLSVREKMKATEASIEFECRFVHRNGEIRWIKWHWTSDATTGSFYGSGVDKSSERIAKEQSMIFRELLESSKNGFGYFSPDGRLVYLNRFLVEDLGWSLDGKTITDYFSPSARLLFEAEILPAVFGRGEIWEGEVEYQNSRTGELLPIWQRTFCPLHPEGMPQHVAFFATDLRAKRRAEAAIVHSSKMASLGQMAAGIAHEVNNPITIIHGTVGLLKKAIQNEKPDFDKIRIGLERVEKTSLRISRIVKGLRMFSRSDESDPPLPMSLAEVLEETLDLCRERFLEYSIDLRIESIPDLSIRCHPTQISQVLLNLLNNSFDAVVREAERWIHIEFLALVSDRVQISITNSGPKISEEVQRHLMEPFFTTKEPGKGTGLGLPISRGIIEEHGGTLLYHPETKNTCFAVELPCVKK